MRRLPTCSRRLSAVVVCAAAVLAFGCGHSEPGKATSPPGEPVASAVRPEDEPPANLVTEEPTPARPVIIGAALRPAKVRAGGTLTLYVQVRIAPTWHIYGPEGSPDGNAPTTLTPTLPRGVEEVGPWTYPEARTAAGGKGPVYEGTVLFRQRLRVAAGTAPGPLDVCCGFSYQACDPFSCQPPANLFVQARAEVVAND
jgi:hypothetical protein